MLVAAGNINQDYEVIGLVVGFASKAEGCSGQLKVEPVYDSARNRLMESARAARADGLIHVSFQNRVAAMASCAGSKQVFEVFAWGTAIRLRPPRP